MMPTAVAAGALFPEFFQAEAFQGDGGSYLAALVLLPIVMVWDALFLSFFGTSVGKGLIGLRLGDRQGRNLVFGRSLQRSVLLYFKGLWMGIPLLWLAGAATGKSDLEKHGMTAWDRATDSRVYDLGTNALRTTFIAVVALVLLAAVQAISKLPMDRY